MSKTKVIFKTGNKLSVPYEMSVIPEVGTKVIDDDAKDEGKKGEYTVKAVTHCVRTAWNHVIIDLEPVE